MSTGFVCSSVRRHERRLPSICDQPCRYSRAAWLAEENQAAHPPCRDWSANPPTGKVWRWRWLHVGPELSNSQHRNASVRPRPPGRRGPSKHLFSASKPRIQHIKEAVRRSGERHLRRHRGPDTERKTPEPELKRRAQANNVKQRWREARKDGGELESS